jgi:predicted  nucleic acid-binding Zn-ribbon protein
MIPKGEIDPAQQAILDDMKARITKQTEEAKGGADTAKYDAILMAGLAMMGGRSLAEGIALAAQTGGATYMANKKEAKKALNDAEKAELAFRQYQLDVMKGNDKSAQDQFKTFMDYTTKMADISSRERVGMARASAEKSPFDVFADAQRVLNANKDYQAMTAAEKELVEKAQKYANSPTLSKQANEQLATVRNKRAQYERNFYESYSPQALMAWQTMSGNTGQGAASSGTPAGTRIKYDAQGKVIP